MKLSRNKMLLVSFMLFSLFFGAGNLIFPPRRWCCRCWGW